MNKFMVLQIDTDVGNPLITSCSKEDQIAFTQIIQVNRLAVLFKHFG